MDARCQKSEHGKVNYNVPTAETYTISVDLYEQIALNSSHGGHNSRILTANSGHRASQADKILNTELGWRFTKVVFTPL